MHRWKKRNGHKVSGYVSEREYGKRCERGHEYNEYIHVEQNNQLIKILKIIA